MIRRANHADADAVLALTKEFVISFAVDEEAFRASLSAFLADNNAYLAVAEVEAKVVGYILALSHHTLYANGRVAWVEELMVDAEHRRHGIGKSLMETAEQWAALQGCKLIALATRRAAAFYEAIDYEASATYYRKLIDA
jgi:GNAT superfamily N-acetyltransferase